MSGQGTSPLWVFGCPGRALPRCSLSRSQRRFPAGPSPSGPGGRAPSSAAPVRGRGSGCLPGRKRKAAGELRRAGEEPPPPACSIPKGGRLAGGGDPPAHPAGPAPLRSGRWPGAGQAPPALREGGTEAGRAGGRRSGAGPGTVRCGFPGVPGRRRAPGGGGGSSSLQGRHLCPLGFGCSQKLPIFFFFTFLSSPIETPALDPNQDFVKESEEPPQGLAGKAGPKKFHRGGRDSKKTPEG